MTEKQKRGFALLTPEERSAIASMGGKAVNPMNRAFARDRQLAAESGRKGGTANKRQMMAPQFTNSTVETNS
jgi:general stress protein YciG